MSAPGLPHEMTVIRAGRAIENAPDGIASAPFRVEHLITGEQDGEPTAMRAMLDPGVRTHWHSHPRGQLLLAVSGSGLAQKRSGPLVKLNPGDAVWFAPGELHWHGASEADAFVYVSVQALQAGRAVQWHEPV
ncbi:cupin domain-containing protein [Labrys sp. KNU-23]|uniref:cupin domain-containing protein n=1 Tax=Labrys sp. KNU-23 TaxID=2789216 RepID=UPI0011ED850D|nr:cupin domain-containing protein [Labrys sp. KNU-23]QEN90790.1 cupin domain-containing protein [Labrys sp. KNU-23]